MWKENGEGLLGLPRQLNFERLICDILKGPRLNWGACSVFSKRVPSENFPVVASLDKVFLIGGLCGAVLAKGNSCHD